MRNPKVKVHSLATEAKKKWKEDIKAGHGKGAEYWGGYAGAAYLMSNPRRRRRAPRIAGIGLGTIAIVGGLVWLITRKK